MGNRQCKVASASLATALIAFGSVPIAATLTQEARGASGKVANHPATSEAAAPGQAITQPAVPATFAALGQKNAVTPMPMPSATATLTMYGMASGNVTYAAQPVVALQSESPIAGAEFAAAPPLDYDQQDDEIPEATETPAQRATPVQKTDEDEAEVQPVSPEYESPQAQPYDAEVPTEDSETEAVTPTPAAPVQNLPAEDAEEASPDLGEEPAATPVTPTPAPTDQTPVNPAPVTPTPTPVNPTPVNPEPVPANPTPVTPTPAPTDQTPVNPTPVTPTPVNPTPIPANPTPTQANPTPVNPAPDPVPTIVPSPDLTPVNPAPVNPTPVPVNPTPTQANPTPVYPTPTPVTPAPAKPTPVTPTPVPVSPTPSPVTPTPADPAPAPSQDPGWTPAPSEQPTSQPVPFPSPSASESAAPTPSSSPSGHGNPGSDDSPAPDASPSATPSSNVSPAPAPSTSAEPFPNSIATLGRFATNSGFPNAFPGAADWVQGYLSRGENARNGSPTLRMANPQESRNGSYSVPSAVNPVARPPATSAGSQAQRNGDSPKSVQERSTDSRGPGLSGFVPLAFFSLLILAITIVAIRYFIRAR